jgi:hypothetical protein
LIFTLKNNKYSFFGLLTILSKVYVPSARAFCDDFPCKKLEDYFEKGKDGDKYRVHLLRQREVGLERWLEEVRGKATMQ